MRLPLYQIDAFTRRVLGGNPAAVCPLEAWLDDATLQAIASDRYQPTTPDGLRFKQAATLLLATTQ